MTSLSKQAGLKELAHRLDAEIRALPDPNTSRIREIRRRYSEQLKNAEPSFVLELAWELLQSYDQRWVAYELISSHKVAFSHLREAELEQFGQDINSWWTVDAFARTLSGPAWLKRQVGDDLFQCWAASPDRWWRRAALVSTVALNVRSHGGTGDVPRTLELCRHLAADRDEMVVKAMSWALRELVPHDPAAVTEFLTAYDQILAAQVKREVHNKLSTGLKNPRK